MRTPVTLPCRNRRAFALTDLLVCVALLALVTVVTLPALKRVRAASDSTVSHNNLKLLIRAHAAYSLEQQSRWLNPFNPTTTYNDHPDTADPEWFSARVPDMPGYVWRFNDSGYQTEMFAPTWTRFSLPYIAPGEWRSPVQFDPRDSAALQRLAAIPDSDIAHYLCDGSYWYSPTMWFNPARYTPTPPSTSRGSITAPNQLGGVRSVRYNTTSHVTYPSQKAVLFSRFDFEQTSRTISSGGATQNFRPQWNNPGAKPIVAFADGGVDQISMRKQLEAAAAATWLTPTNPNWNLSTSVLAAWNMHGDHLENGQNGGTMWRAHFWGTMFGISGRDVLPRR